MKAVFVDRANRLLSESTLILRTLLEGIMKAISASSSQRQSSKHGGSGAYQCSNNFLHQVFLFGKLNIIVPSYSAFRKRNQSERQQARATSLWKSPVCSWVSITFPAWSKTRMTASC